MCAGPDEMTCCGLPMQARLEVFGVRVYQCRHRPHHPEVFENLSTGDRTSAEDICPPCRRDQHEHCYKIQLADAGPAGQVCVCPHSHR